MLKRVALLGATVMLALVVADVSYRVIIEPEPIIPPRLGRFDDTLGWAMRPGTSAASKATGQKVVYSINEAGLRDDEVTHEKPAGTFRIALLGDSRTFGYGVPVEQHFSRLIEGYFHNVEALNFGVAGYGVDQKLLTLRTRAFQYQPDLVVAYVAHFGDHRHVHTNRFGKNKPMFEVRGDTLIATNLPVPDRYDGLSRLHQIDVWLTERSPLYRDTSGPVVRALKALLGRGAEPAAPAPGAVEDSTLTDRLYTVALAIVKEMDRESSRAAARFVLLTQLPRLHAEATGAGIVSFDVSAALANPHLQLPRDLAHINEAGNGILAWELVSFLTRQNLIPASHRIDPAKLGPGAS